MADEVAETALADPAAAEVLVPIVIRPWLGFRVVEVDEDQAPEPDASVEVVEESVDRLRLEPEEPVVLTSSPAAEEADGATA